MIELYPRLAEEGVKEVEIQNALRYQKERGGRLDQILVNMGAISKEGSLDIFSELLELPLIDESYDFSGLQSEPPLLLDQSLLSRLNWLWLGKQDDHHLFVTTDPFQLEALQHVQALSEPFEIALTYPPYFDFLTQKLLSESNQNKATSSEGDKKLLELALEAPTVNFLNNLIAKGLRINASDLHLEPLREGELRARFRVDGVLDDGEAVPPSLQLSILSRLKVLAGVDIAERRRPQDGKLQMAINGVELDIRASFLPLNMGESVVLRFLKKDSVTYKLDSLGLSADIHTSIENDLQTTAGVILLTGPTGSGKTTTLYTFLNELNTPKVKIITLEDPVEYQMDGINQVQVNSDIGFDFSAGLRSIVRQDPDIIMVGEIRDQETAKIAMQSALTGHLVFSTVHTNDAASAYTRLLELGVDDYLLNAGLVSILAQRLVRKVCPHCCQDDDKQVENIEKYQLKELQSQYSVNKIALKIAKGCDECNHTGYSGRLAIIEYLSCDSAVRKMPKDSDFLENVRALNRNRGCRNLFEDGMYKAMLGQTTIEEVIRVCGS